MIRAIAWKELREQGLIALTLVVLGGGLLAAAAALAEPPAPGASPSDVIRYLGLGRLATLMLAVTAGMVCGGAVFAAEREAATFPFLDSLPASRWQIWRAKLLAGLGLASAQIAILVGLSALLGMVPTLGWAVAVVLYSLLAFVWGVLGSTTARTTLGSVGIAIPAATLTAFFVLIPVTIFFQNPGSNLPRMNGGIFFLVCMFTIPLISSAWLFTSLDRSRAAEETSRPSRRAVNRTAVMTPRAQIAAPERMTASRRPRVGLMAIVWLTSRQLVVPGLVLSLFAGLFGLSLLVPQAQPFIAWPALALTAGVVAGVTTFADEQTRGAARFWGEQRLPIARFWVTKIALHLLFCLWLLALLALPLIVRTQFENPEQLIRTQTFLAMVFRAPLFDELGSQGWKFLFVPAVYGFAAGHLCGLVFRKLVVSCGVAGIVGATSAALWGPSLLAGGVRHWQLWLPPIAILLTGFFVLRAWVSERIPTRPAIMRLAGGAVATVAILAIGISYRVLEIPDRPGSEDDIAYVDSLVQRMPIDGKHGGRDYKAAAERFNRLATSISPAFDRNEFPSRIPKRDRVDDRANRALRNGWPSGDEELGRWLDTLFLPSTDGEPAWYANAAKAAEAPIGIFEYPQLLGLAGPSTPALEYAQRMSEVLLARGLQRQATHPDEFPELLRTVFTLARTLRNGSIIASYLAGADVERAGLLALDRWLERLPHDSHQVRPLIDLLLESELTEPFDPTPHLLAERHVLREGMKTPAQWLPVLLASPGTSPDATTTEVDLVGLAWAVPWERERTRRLVAMGFEAGYPTSHPSVIGRPGLGLLIGRARSPRDLTELERLLTTHRRAAILKLALRAYRSDRGSYPNSLTELESAGYLRESPRDPYAANQPFGYRLSQPPGEELVNPTRLATERPGAMRNTGPSAVVTQRVPSGQPILWSVGLDGIDQEGRNIPAELLHGQARPADLVYLVPLGEEKAVGDN